MRCIAGLAWIAMLASAATATPRDVLGPFPAPPGGLSGDGVFIYGRAPGTYQFQAARFPIDTLEAELLTPIDWLGTGIATDGSADGAVVLTGVDSAGGVEVIQRAVGRVLTEEEANWVGDL